MKISVDIISRCIGCSCINFNYIHITCTCIHCIYVYIYVGMYVCMFVYMRVWLRMYIGYWIVISFHSKLMGLFHPWTSIDHPWLSSFFVPQVELFEISRPCSPKKNTEKVQGNFGRDMSHQAFDPCHSTEGSQMFEENSSSVQNAEVQFNSTDPSFQTKYRIFCKLSISTSNATSLRKGMI